MRTPGSSNPVDITGEHGRDTLVIVADIHFDLRIIIDRIQQILIDGLRKPGILDKDLIGRIGTDNIRLFIHVGGK